jgi:hypothetical protein
MPRPLRANSSTPSSCSSPWIRAVSAGWVTLSEEAARLTCPSRATATTASTWLSCIAPFRSSDINKIDMFDHHNRLD